MTQLFKILLFLWLIVFPMSAQATTYYVCDDGTDCNAGDGSGWSTGDNGNNGTAKATPWKTIEYAAENVALGGGDTVIVGDGTYSTDSTISSNYNIVFRRAFTNWNIFKAENDWQAHISAVSGNNGVISVGYAAAGRACYVRIEGFEMSGGSSGVVWGNTGGEGGHYLYFYNNLVHTSPNAIISISYTDNVTIDSNLIYDITSAPSNQYHGVYIGTDTDDWVVKNNIIYDIPAGFPIHRYSGSSDNIQIYNNTMTDENTLRDGCIVIWNATNSIIRNNICYQIEDSAYDNYAIADTGLDATNIIEYNLTNLADICKTDSEQSCGLVNTGDGSTLNADLSDEFTDHSSRDYTQQADALSIDTGTSTGAPDVDYLGNARPAGGADDIGAYEFQGPTVTVTATDAAADEDGGTGEYTIACSPNCAGETINFSYSGSATIDTDYDTDDEDGTKAITGASATITLTPVDDADIESTETATLTIDAGTGYSAGSPSSADILITDNDDPAPPPGGGDITIGGGSHTLAIGGGSHTLTISPE